MTNEEMLAKLTENQLVLQQAMIELTQTVSRYVDASNARVTRLEANLDALIEAITREHSNGKGEPGKK